jgi:hypothetical protein
VDAILMKDVYTSLDAITFNWIIMSIAL